MKPVSPVDLNSAARAIANAAKTRFAGKKDEAEHSPGGIILPDAKLLTDVFGYAGKGEVGTTHTDLIRGMNLLRPGDTVLLDVPMPKPMRLIDEPDSPPRAALMARVDSNDANVLVLANPFATDDNELGVAPVIAVDKRVHVTPVAAREGMLHGVKLPPRVESLRQAFEESDTPWDMPDEATLASHADKLGEHEDLSRKAQRRRQREMSEFLGLNAGLLRGLAKEEDRILEMAERQKRHRADMPDLELPTVKIANQTWHNRLNGVIRALTRRGKVVDPAAVKAKDVRVRVRGFVGASADEPLKVIVAPDEQGYQTPSKIAKLSARRLFDPERWVTQMLSPFSPTARENDEAEVPPGARIFYTMSPAQLKVVRGRGNLFVLNN